MLKTSVFSHHRLESATTNEPENNFYQNGRIDFNHLGPVAQIQAEMESRATNFGYGLGVALGRMIGTVPSEDEESEGNENNIQPGLIDRFLDKISNKIKDFWYANTALHRAVIANNIGYLREIIDNYEDLNIQDHEKATPADYAIRMHHLEALEILVKNGLKLNNDYSSQLWPHEIIRVLSWDPKNDMTIHVKNYLEKGGNIEDLIPLLEKGLNPSHLKIATIQHGNVQAFAKLHTHGVDLFALEHDGRSLFEIALSFEQYEVADYLKEIGVKKHRPIIIVVTDVGRDGFMFKKAIENISNLKLFGLPVSENKHSNYNLIKKIKTQLAQLPVGVNRCHAILDSGIEEVVKIKEYAKKVFDYCDSILLEGGPDIQSFWYGIENPKQTSHDVQRDIFEMALLQLQQKSDYKPLLGICRGHQILNVFYGGTLKNEGESDTKPLVLHKSTGILGGAFPFSDFHGYSSHHQSIEKLGSTLETVLLSPQGMIKAIQANSDLPLMGTQFHPEAISQNTIKGKHALDRFFDLTEASYQDTCFAYDLDEQSLKKPQESATRITR